MNDLMRSHKDTEVNDVVKPDAQPVQQCDSHTREQTCVPQCELHIQGKWISTCAQEGTHQEHHTRAPDQV